ncbi:unnamed protein product [Ceratitis capitata]|uniref:(Mediterranean fruit fly) hypothetical protein n=1 Tax=Ceratitis capitata TaxID=7213 RepID=A0A811V4D7_CERCA|nr:unnamed protein product [Ceratitis capitata]
MCLAFFSRPNQKSVQKSRYCLPVSASNVKKRAKEGTIVSKHQELQQQIQHYHRRHNQARPTKRTENGQKDEYVQKSFAYTQEPATTTAATTSTNSKRLAGRQKLDDRSSSSGGWRKRSTSTKTYTSYFQVKLVDGESEGGGGGGSYNIQSNKDQTAHVGAHKKAPTAKRKKHAKTYSWSHRGKK